MGNDANKLDLTVLPTIALREAARSIQNGDEKYGIETRYEGEARRHVAGALRHILEWMDGISTDADDGISSLSHAVSRLMMARQMEYDAGHTTIDPLKMIAPVPPGGMRPFKASSLGSTPNRGSDDDDHKGNIGGDYMRRGC